MLRNFYSSIVILSLFAIAEGCTNDLASPNIQNSVVPGDAAWRITWYWDKDKDETSDFAQYTFYFRNNGSFDAIRNGTTTTGTWHTTSNDGMQRLVISTSAAKPLSNLNDDWVILESGDQIKRLRDDNVTQLEELNFEHVQ